MALIRIVNNSELEPSKGILPKNYMGSPDQLFLSKIQKEELRMRASQARIERLKAQREHNREFQRDNNVLDTNMEP